MFLTQTTDTRFGNNTNHKHSKNIINYIAGDNKKTITNIRNIINHITGNKIDPE